MTYLTNLKKLGVKSTVLVSSVALVACGGGGSDGYFGDQNNNNNNNTGGNGSTTDTKTVVESLNLSLQDANAKPIGIASDNSKVLIAVQALNSDKGGVAAKLVNLSIADSDKLGVTSKTSQVTTGDDGFAVFEVSIPTLNSDSGKVQLTVNVDGTTIKQVYTLNIKKTSTIQSEYNLKVQQGTVLNLPKGSVNITAQVTDKNGGVKSNQTVSLALPAEMQGKFSIANGSNLTTDSSGNAIFTITASSDLTAADISKFVATSMSLDFKLVDEFKAEGQAKASITFKDISQVVQKLEIVTEDAPIVAQGGTTKVTVVAKNSNGDLLPNKKVKLSFTDNSAVYGVSINAQEVTTDANGYAVFTLKSVSSYPVALSQQQVNLKATFVDVVDIFATTTVKVTTADTSAANQQALQRLEIASSYKVNAKNDSVTIIVKGINNKGEAATQGKVKLSLNAEAGSNGVTFDGSDEQEFKTGYVTYTLKTNASTTAAIDALVKAGITATFTTDNDVSNKIDITVEDEAVSEEKVRYLAFEPITQRIDYTKSQVVSLKVQAVGEGDSALKGEQISLTRFGLSTEQLQNLGFTPKGSSTKLTDENGFAEFEFQYTFANTQAQKDLVLNPEGIRLLAKSMNDKIQFLDLKFKEPSATGDITLESLVIDTQGLATLALNQVVTISVTVKATGSDGQAHKNQKVGLGLNEAALQNGASIVGGASKITDTNGNVSFQIQVIARNAGELENLVANGLTLAVKGTDTNIAALRKIELFKPAVVLQDLASLDFVSVDEKGVSKGSLDTLSVLGGEARVRVTAKDANGKFIPNTPIAIALSSLTSSRVSISNMPATTNSKGEAEFTVTVAEGQYDAGLIKNNIVFAVVGTNLNNGDRLQQTSSIGITTPANALNPRLTADVNTITAGQTVKVYASVKDEMGLNTAAGTPMRLSLNPEATTAGVKLASEAVVVLDNGSVAVDLIVPKAISSATLSSIIVTGTIRDPRGNEIPTNLTFTVQDAINPYHLTIDSNRVSLSSAGDTALVTVKLLDANQGGVANQSVTLAVADPRTVTSIKGASQIVTNEFGEAVFELSMKAVAGLVAPIPNIVLTATHTNENGVVVRQTSQFLVHTPTALAPQLDLKIKASKDKLHVRGDAVDVAVLVTDVNGSSQSGKTVTLTIPNYSNNGAYIRGASTIESDENGWAKFTVVVDESLRIPGYTAAQFVNEDLNIEAVVKDAQNTERRQSHLVDVVAANVPVTQGSITVVMNPTRVGIDDATGIYYNWNASAQVTDLDGRPVANQKVTMDIRATEFVRGQWIPVTKLGDAEPSSWAQFPPLSCPVPTTDDPTTPYDERNVTKTGEQDRNGDDVLETLNAVRFIGASEANPYTATYTTDREGKFDFEIRYPKTYGAWLSVQVGATTTLSTYPVHGYRTVTLPTVADDFDKTNWAYTPSINNQSPYGILGTCK